MALLAQVPCRSRMLAMQKEWHREQAARWQQKNDINAKYFQQQHNQCHMHNLWSSAQTFQQSMSAYHKQIMRKEKIANLERRRNHLRVLLQEEQDQLEAEIKKFAPTKETLLSQLVEKAKELRSVREERKAKRVQELMRQHWKKSDPLFREAELALHTDHVVGQWKGQISDKTQQKVTEQEEKRRFEDENERSWKESLEREKLAEEQRRAEQRKTGEDLLKQMGQLKLKEEEANRRKQEQDALLRQQWDQEKIEEERQMEEERRKKAELGRMMKRQYCAHLKRKAQKVQEELEADRQILAALMEADREAERRESAERKTIPADPAWMKRMIEEQLQLEKKKEAELEILHREDAERVWEKREAQWEKERLAREQLMKEVLEGRQQQLEFKMQQCHKAQERAQEEARRRREELEEEEMERRCLESTQTAIHNRARRQDLNAQVEQRQKNQREEQCRVVREREEEQEALHRQEERVRQEVQRIADRGYQEKNFKRQRSELL